MAGNVSLKPQKEALRKVVEERRRALDAEVVRQWGGEVQRHLAASDFLKHARVVAAYTAQSFEVPLFTLMEELHARGVQVLVPRLVKGSRDLIFREEHGPLSPPLSPLTQGEGVSLDSIDVWLVPGVAFTRDGGRLGRGAGYYDRALAKRRAGAVLVGITCELCVVEEVPMDSHDVPMDFIVTEAGVAPTFS